MFNPTLLLQKTKLRIEEAAEILEVTPRTVQRYLETGKLATVLTPGGQRRVRTDSVLQYL